MASDCLSYILTILPATLKSSLVKGLTDCLCLFAENSLQTFSGLRFVLTGSPMMHNVIGAVSLSECKITCLNHDVHFTVILFAAYLWPSPFLIFLLKRETLENLQHDFDNCVII